MTTETPTPSPTPTPTPAPTPAPAPAPSPAPTPSPESKWYQPFNLDAASVDYINAKGINDPGGLIKVAQDFEKVARDRNAIAKPTDLAKLSEWDGWSELGWNKDAGEYAKGFAKPEVKEGQAFSEDLFSLAQKTAHELRMPASMGSQFYNKMFAAMNDMAAKFGDAQKLEADNRAKELDGALRGKWSADYDKNAGLARKAVAALGVAKEGTAELEKIIGAPALVELFHTIGSKLGEDTLAGINQGAGGQMTPEMAQVELNKLQADPEFLKVLNEQRDPRYQEFMDKRQRLIDRIAAGRRS